jgi:hypothetical protein
MLKKKSPKKQTVKYKQAKKALSKADKAYSNIVNFLSKEKLTVEELLLVLSNVNYAVGASIGGYGPKGPSAQELEREYAIKPTVDKALMLTGVTISQWISNLDKKYEEILAEEKNKQNDRFRK